MDVNVLHFRGQLLTPRRLPTTLWQGWQSSEGNDSCCLRVGRAAT
jgi:hypothetical protein